MNASSQDVAKAAHVSISTVYRSFTRPELVSAATRGKVPRIPDELHFPT
ncbi:LacI family DNA-binding transcriptional regulator, partial [Bifidobacterium animalis]